MADVGELEADPNEKSSALPLRATVWVLPATPLAFSVIVSVPVSAPPAAGVNVALMVQEPLAATLLPQLLVWVKFALVAMLVIERAAEPPFVSVIRCDAIVVPTIRLPKVRLRGGPGQRRGGERGCAGYAGIVAAVAGVANVDKMRSGAEGRNSGRSSCR